MEEQRRRSASERDGGCLLYTSARMYNGSGSLGKLDVLLQPFYDTDTKSETLTDEEATFHIACLLLRDTGYIQLGGPDATGKDVTSKVSYLVLEAAHRLGIPANIGVSLSLIHI